MPDISTIRAPLTLVLGGTRSGKSKVAEDLARQLADAAGLLTYVATAAVDPADADHAARIDAHRVRRPASWATVECPDPAHLAAVLAATDGPVLLDSLGTWVAGHPDLSVDGPALAAALRSRPHPTIVVSEEVGWSLHAPTVVGRRFVDALGSLNQDVAAIADRVLLVVAGRILELPPVLSALSFLTIVGRGGAPDARTFRWFPLAGAAIGGVVALSLAGAREVWSYPLAAAVAVAVDLAITGMLHVDGLADSADGLLPHLDRERRLEVMRQPDTGAFALGTVLVVFLLRWTALADGAVDPWSVVAVWCISRTIVAVVPAVVPYARPSGLASAFLTGTGVWIGLAVLPALGLLVWAQGLTGALAGLAAIAAAVGLVAWARARLGGFTGDVLGAAILVSETLALVVLAAHP